MTLPLTHSAMESDQQTSRIDVRDDGLVGTFLHPEPRIKLPALILLGGSRGGIASAERLAEFVAHNGFAGLALSYFKMENLPDALELIPLEYFEKAIRWLQAQSNVDSNRVGVIGLSKGGELALILASRYPALKAVAAFVPSAVVFQSIPGGLTSSWSYKSIGLSFVPYRIPVDTEIGPGNWTPMYLESLKQEGKVVEASIEVEKINGPIILFSGTKDKMWPSTLLCNMVINRLSNHRFPFYFEHFAYDHGHAVDRREDALVQLMKFLQEHLN